MNWKLSSTVGALTLMTATALSNISPANAAALIGNFNIGGAVNFIGFDGDDPGNAVDLRPGTVNGVATLVPATTFDFLDIDDAPGFPFGEFAVLPGNTGTFANFDFPELGTIRDLPFAPALPPGGIPGFLDFSFTLGGGTPTPGNTFRLTSIGNSNYLDIDQDGDGENDASTVSIGVTGEFISANGGVSTARGTFSADFNILSALVISQLTDADGPGPGTGPGRIDNVSYSAQFVAVPESSTTAGLVAFGLAGVVALARKRQSFSLK